MKKLIFLSLFFATLQLAAQPTGYYNGTEGKTGEELKSALNDIISGHMEWAYFYAKDIFLQSDAVPGNPGYVYTVYKGSEVDASDNENWGTGGDYLNREHVWAKSHGQFDTELPTGGDAHNLKPADGSVNVDRSNKDFDNCQATGTQHPEATGCWYTSNAWEPRDEVKGDIARIIFYMATRYEGENGEVDLEVNDQLDNSPDPLHGKLSALLQWNEQDPPDAFERNRNDVIFGYQQNRNPFIDNPDWVNMIWDGTPANSISIADVSQSQELVFTGDAIDISATITGAGSVTANLNWGTDIENMTNTISMNASGDIFTAQIPAQASETDIYFSVEATDDNGTHQSVPYMYHVEATFSGTTQPISEVQGEQASSPYDGNEVTITGIVTANFGEGFFVQDAAEPWSGIYVYDVLNPQIGDSVILTGTVDEYYDLTEITNVTDYYLISRNNTLPDPIVVTAANATEAYEGVFIQIQNATCTSVDEGYGMWQVTDDSGNMLVHNNQVYEFEPELNEAYNITGPLKWGFGEWKIEIRKPEDVAAGTDITPPSVNEIEVNSATSISVIFSENLEETTAEDITNYQFNNGIEAVSATLGGFTPYIVNLEVTGLNAGTHEITVNNVQDVAGNVMNEQIIEFTSTVEIDDIDGFNQKFNVYPNPSENGQLTIKGIENIATIQITDAAGRVFSDINNTGNSTITVNKLESGIYFIKLTTNTNKQAVTKFIVK